MREDRTRPERERRRALVEHARARDVRGQQVGRELQPRERAVDGAGEGARDERLADARHVLDQHVALGDERDDDQLERAALGMHDGGERVDDRAYRRCGIAVLIGQPRRLHLSKGTRQIETRSVFCRTREGSRRGRGCCAAIACLSAFAIRSAPSRDTSTTSLSVLSKPMSARDTSFSTTRSRPLRSSFARARSTPSAPGLGREADEHLARPACGADGREDVVGRLELERPGALALVLRVERARRPVVGDGGGHQHDVGRGGLRQGLALELGRGLDVDDLPEARPHLRVGDDGDHLGAAARRLVGERRAHPARAAVAEEAHGVERLARAARGDEDATAGQRTARAEQRRDRRRDRRGLAHAAHAPLALGERALLGADQDGAALGERRHVGARRGVLPHADVHGRRHDERAGCGERALRHDVVGEPVRELRERVRGARRDAHERRDARGVEMRVAAVERRRVAQHGSSAERGEGLGADEALGLAGQRDLHAEARLQEQTDELTRSVGGDSTRDSEQNRRSADRRRRQVAAGSSHSIFPAASSSSAMVR